MRTLRFWSSLSLIITTETTTRIFTQIAKTFQRQQKTQLYVFVVCNIGLNFITFNHKYQIMMMKCGAKKKNKSCQSFSKIIAWAWQGITILNCYLYR